MQRTVQELNGSAMDTEVYRPQVHYQKAGVMLSELVPEEGQQTDLLEFLSINNKSGRLMETVDSINRKYKRNTIHLASEGTAPDLVHAAQFQESKLHGRLARAASW
jgi:DNA polymerase V